jgi:hypothetical protein
LRAKGLVVVFNLDASLLKNLGEDESSIEPAAKRVKGVQLDIFDEAMKQTMLEMWQIRR